jgi:(2Fe-2S) ferredoxin
MVQPKYHVFICTSCTIAGQQRGFCYNKGSVNIVQKFMEEITDRDLSGEVVVNNTGCFGICSKGTIVVVYPEGIWYGNVTEDDVERIFDEHFERGTPVKEFMI